MQTRLVQNQAVQQQKKKLEVCDHSEWSQTGDKCL